MIQPCEDFTATTEVGPPRDVCQTCVDMGSTWVHLRQCLNCGGTLCCDNSPNQHATAHFRADGHPMIQSAVPGEDWRWCFTHEYFYIPSAVGYEVVED